MNNIYSVLFDTILGSVPTKEQNFVKSATSLISRVKLNGKYEQSQGIRQLGLVFLAHR
jgi:hypothetical protein